MRKFPTALGAAAFAASLAVACAHPSARPEMSAGAPAAAGRATDAPREQTADQQVRQALNRLAFGARPGDYERVRAMGVDRWIDEQLHPASIDDGAMDEFLSRFPTLRLSSEELARQYPPPNQLLAERRRELMLRGQSMSGDSLDKRGEVLRTREDSAEFRRAAQQSQRVAGEMQVARVARAVGSNRQLEEVMVDFWENHFTVFAGKGPTRYMLQEYERDAIRPHALGKFRDLLGAVAKSPAMLYYLDNWESMADSGRPRLTPAGRALPPRLEQQAQRRGLNENYGRELLELHTLGVDGGYTQQDVIDVARALTGWTIQNPRQGGGFVFRPFMHDAGEKVVLGHHLPAGRGIEDGEEVLDIVSRHPATARFIATKLARRFVSDSPPPTLIARAAATFRRTDGDIREVVRTIVTSPEFFSRAAYRAKVKSPFELVVSALRAVNAQPDSTPRTAQVIARMGEPIFGHQAPNGYPETGGEWINTGSILNRINFGLALASGRFPGASLGNWQEGSALAAKPRAEQVDGVVAALLGGEASPDTRKILESGSNPFLQRPPAPDSTAQRVGADTTVAAPPDTAAMATRLAARPGRMGRGDPLGRPAEPSGFAQLVGLALGAPEFQRR